MLFRSEKENTGWKYGPLKDPEKKEHPCFLPYDQLPVADRMKDHVFVKVVNTMADALLSTMHPDDILSINF